ncbi:MAG: thioredoxin [Rhizobium sp.]|nr:thioredoxin [Rhizobium sp.]
MDAIVNADIRNHPVVSREEWTTERLELLRREKEFSRLRDDLAAARRSLPWVRIDKDYLFDGPDGKQALRELFDGRSQLIIYHFMFGPGWEQGCPSCSFVADHIDGATIHLADRDVTLLAVSRAPLAELEPFRARMGWRFKWLSSNGSDFNYDFGVSFPKADVERGMAPYNYGSWIAPIEDLQGASVFYKDDAGEVFHTYSTYGRGIELLVGAYNYLDLAPKGRNEDGLSYPMAWVRHHDRYDPQPNKLMSCCL